MATLSSLRRFRGTTLFEVVLAVLIFSALILAVTLTLVTEAGRRIRHSGARAGDTDVRRVIDRIRTDVWGSSSIAIPPDYDPYATWYEGPLVVTGHWSGYQIGYGVQGDVLFRVTRRPGQEPETAEILRDVGSFHWRFLDGVSRRSVLLEILHSETATFRGPEDPATGPSDMAERVVLSPRRVQSSRW